MRIYTSSISQSKVLNLIGTMNKIAASRLYISYREFQSVSVCKLIFFIAILFMSSALSANKPPKQIGEFKKWNVYVMQQNNKKISYVVTTPVKQEGKYKSRGKPYIMITNRPPKSYGVVSIHAGYDYPENYTVKAKIDNKTFNFHTSTETPGAAWLSHEQDAEFNKSLSNGKKLIVYGKSAKGTQTTDTYELSGSSLAIKEAKNACKK